MSSVWVVFIIGVLVGIVIGCFVGVMGGYNIGRSERSLYMARYRTLRNFFKPVTANEEVNGRIATVTRSYQYKGVIAGSIDPTSEEQFPTFDQLIDQLSQREESSVWVHPVY